MNHVVYVYFVLLHLMIYFSFSLLLTENLQYLQVLLLRLYRFKAPYNISVCCLLAFNYLTSFNISFVEKLANSALTIFFVFCYVIIDLQDGYFRLLVVLNSHKLHGLVHRSLKKRRLSYYFSLLHYYCS